MSINTNNQRGTSHSCNKPIKHICKCHVNKKHRCSNTKCKFNHHTHTTIASSINKTSNRQIGYCYCGAKQKRFFNKRNSRSIDNKKIPIFFIVCSRTRRPIKYCM